MKIKHAKYLCNVRRPIPMLVAKVWWWNLDYMKNLQVKYFTGEISQSMVYHYDTLDPTCNKYCDLIG